MSNSEASKSATATVLLGKASIFLREMMESSYFDLRTLANDCLEDFDNFEWEPSKELTSSELEHWKTLRELGMDGELDYAGLRVFIKLTATDSQCHTFFTRIKAAELLEEINQYQDEG